MANRAAWLRMRRVEGWPLRTKLAMVLLIPALAAVVFGADRVYAELVLARQTAMLQDEAAAMNRAVLVAHGLQRERDLSLGNGGAGLAEQRKQVDAAVAAFNAELAGHPDLTAQDARIAQAQAQLRDLPSARTASDRPATSRLTVFGSYSTIISPLLALAVAIEDQADDGDLRRTAGALVDVGRAIEQIQSQQAVLAGTTANGALSAEALAVLRVAEARLDDALSDLRATLSDGQEFGAAVEGKALDRREQAADQILAPDQPAVRPAAQIVAWQQASQPVADQLARFETALSGSLSQAVSQLSTSSKASSLQDAALVIGALLLGLVLALYFATTLLRPLWILRRRALDVAKRELPEVIENFARSPEVSAQVLPAQVEVSTTEEIGQLARAFDEVHTSAVRLAAEQAALRHSVNEIFVSLSRRTQSLVDNQLRMIEDMEAEELDPDQLDRLFKLDHLATRMRRNSENLLVLAGASLRRSTRRPVPLTGMLQAAVSEIEQYTRIVLKPAPELVLVGDAVSDAVHLLAELLDNATTFSPPQTQVTVVCTQYRRGDLRIAVADEGVGLSTAELEELNRQLATSAPIEAAVSQKMGLFVVSRLAARRGITVRLRNNIGSGIIADVTLPGDVLRPAESTPPAVSPQRALTGASAVTARKRYQVEAAAAEDKVELPQRPPDAPRASWRLGGTTAPAQTLVEPAPESAPPSRPEPEEPSATAPEPLWPREEPAELTPIFDRIFPAWFREPPQGASAEDAGWSPAMDEIWHAGDRLDDPVADGFTAAGLPRRVRGALLVRGSVRAAEDEDRPQPPPPNGAELKRRMASYQSGMRRVRGEHPSQDNASRRNGS
ncbi:hypothetical protein GCM10010174_39720 [Kutzneria viridogrisea]|uniref:histidine kinase n=1 Tax=Kutzneria viridogrisea TaxID=47990 RepID=A0ABR6BMP1_9PSEU|nr:signal transduction histidine kinase [Kutzneria viridogrisea]